MKFGRIVLQVNIDMHQLMESNFWFKMAAVTSFHATKCCHLVSEHEASAAACAAVSVSSWSIVHLYLLMHSFCVFVCLSNWLCRLFHRCRNWGSRGAVAPQQNYWGATSTSCSPNFFCNLQLKVTLQTVRLLLWSCATSTKCFHIHCLILYILMLMDGRSYLDKSRAIAGRTARCRCKFR